MSEASEVELLMLDLINQERTSRGLNPLTINNALNDASEDHSQWMLDTNTFSHTGGGGSSATDRIAASDYELEGRWQTAENIGVQSLRGEPGIADDVAQVHQSLMNSAGHRANLLDPNLEDIGIGIEVGDFTYDSGFRGESVMITQNFGRTDAVQSPPTTVEDDMDSAPPVEPETPPAQEQPVAEPPEPELPAEDPMPEVVEDTPEDVTPPAPDLPEPTPDDEDTDMAEAPMPEVPSDDEGMDDMPEPTPEVEEPPAPDMPEDDNVDVVDMPSDDMFDCPALDNMFVFTTRFTLDFADMFEFNDMTADDDDATVVSAFEGTVATSEGTNTTTDPAEFNDLLAELFAGFGFGNFDVEWM